MKQETSKELLSALKGLKQFEDGLTLAQSIRENLELVGRKKEDTLEKWHGLGAIIESIKADIGSSYGSGLVRVLSEAFCHDEADLHRAAKFARSSPDYKVFREKNPEVTDLRKAVRTAGRKTLGDDPAKQRSSRPPSVTAIERNLVKLEEKVADLIRDYSLLIADGASMDSVADRLANIGAMLNSLDKQKLPGAAEPLSETTPESAESYRLEVVPYEECTAIETKIEGNLADATIDRIAQVVLEITVAEGPIHRDDLVQRVGQVMSPNKRLGKVSVKKIKDAIELALWEKATIRQDAGFLWPFSHKHLSKVRFRQQPQHRKHISDQELQLAAALVLETNPSGDLEMVAKEALRTLGFVKPRKTECERVLDLLDPDRYVVPDMPEQLPV